MKRSWLGLVEKELRAGLTMAEARDLLASSNLRKGVFDSDLIWWRFETHS